MSSGGTERRIESDDGGDGKAGVNGGLYQGRGNVVGRDEEGWVGDD